MWESYMYQRLAYSRGEAGEEEERRQQQQQQEVVAAEEADGKIAQSVRGAMVKVFSSAMIHCHWLHLCTTISH